MFPQESLPSSPTACTVATAQLPESAAALTVVATPVYSISHLVLFASMSLHLVILLQY